MEDHSGWRSLAKSLQTTNGIGGDINLIPFRREKTPQNLPQSTIVLDNQNPPHWGESQS